MVHPNKKKRIWVKQFQPGDLVAFNHHGSFCMDMHQYTATIINGPDRRGCYICKIFGEITPLDEIRIARQGENAVIKECYLELLYHAVPEDEITDIEVLL